MPKKKTSRRKIRIIQSIHIDKHYAPELATAKAMVKLIGGSVRNVDETENFWRFRQQDPDLFQKHTLRHWHRGPGVREIVGLPLPEYQDQFYALAK